MPNASSANAPKLDTVSLITLMEQRYEAKDEAAFLRQQAADAKVAMQRTLAAMQDTAKSAADVGAWTQTHPWYAVGIAATAGFIAATTVLSPPPPRPGASTETAAAAGSSLLASGLSLLWGMGRGVLMRAIVTALGATMAEADDDENASEHVSGAK